MLLSWIYFIQEAFRHVKNAGQTVHSVDICCWFKACKFMEEVPGTCASWLKGVRGGILFRWEKWSCCDLVLSPMDACLLFTVSFFFQQKERRSSESRAVAGKVKRVVARSRSSMGLIPTLSKWPAAAATIATNEEQPWSHEGRSRNKFHLPSFSSICLFLFQPSTRRSTNMDAF